MPFRSNFGAIWEHFWSNFGAFLSNIGAILEPFWHSVGPLLLLTGSAFEARDGCLYAGLYACTAEATLSNMIWMILHVLPQLFHFARFPFMSGKVSFLLVRPSRGPDGAQTAQDGSKTAKTAQDRSEVAQREPKMVPRRP